MRHAASLVLGCLLPLAFAPFDWWPLAILIPALLLWNVDVDWWPRSLMLSGWLFGVGYFGFGVYWVYNSLHDFGQAPPSVAAAITGLLVVYLALAPALVLLCQGWSKRRLGAASLWLLPFFWFGFEWFKGWFLTGMPWLSLGYAHTDSPLSGFAPLIGVYGIGALSLLMSVAFYIALRERRFAWLGVVLAVPLAGWLLQQVDWTEPMERRLEVTMVQGNIPQEVKWRYDQRQNIFNTYWRETSRHWDSDLIIWPETALPGRSEDIEQTVLRPVQEMVRRQGSALMTGLVVSEKANDHFYNSVALLGETRTYYHKRHLVLFGEYYPMRWLLDLMSGVISIPYSDLTAGPAEQPEMRVDGLVLGVSICFEDAFSRDIMLALPSANLLVNLSNDAWFGNSTAPHQHLQIARMRALESERAMLRSTNTGVSAFIDHNGSIIAQTRQFQTESITAVVEGRRGATPFYYFARVQGFIALLPFLLAVWLTRRRGA